MYIPAWPSLNPAYFVKPEVREGAPFPLENSRTNYFYVARNAIYRVMRSLKLEGAVVLAPDYHHGNEISAMKAAGVNIRYYPVQKNLDADFDAIARLCDAGPKPRALYVTHFIGWPQPMDIVRRFCRDHRLTLIEDCALSFMSELDGKPLGSFGEYSVFCLYKSLPLPNGGVLVSNSSAPENIDCLQPCSALSVSGRSAELMLQWIRARSNIVGKALFACKRVIGGALNERKVRRTPVGDTGFDISAANTGMSRVSQKLLARFHYNSIRETRRRNFKVVEESLRGRARLLEIELRQGVCPLFFPLLVKEKHAASIALLDRGIETVEFWNEGDQDAHCENSGAEFLRRHVLEIPIHQDLTAADAAFVADQIVKLDLCL
jgi:dTDP-4-amino-4,6-dideoxygalactose transaminase